MRNQVDNKFTWVIQNFNSLQSNQIYSDQFMIGGCKWKLFVFPKGFEVGYLSLYLTVADSGLLRCGWRRHAKVSFTLVNQVSQNLSRKGETQHWFDMKSWSWGFPQIVLLTKLHERGSGFLVNGQLRITVEVDVLEVIGKLDVSEVEDSEEDESESDESKEEMSQPIKKRKQDNGSVLSSDLLYNTQQLKEVNGFLALPSQAESVKRIFEKHPNMALDFQAKSQRLRTSIMNALLDLIDTLCQSLQDLSIDDLSQADNTLTYLKNSGFKVDWLERKLDDVKDKKMEEETGEIRVQELEEEVKEIKSLLEKKKEELKDLKKKCSNTEALLKKEKAKVLAARTPRLTLDDVV